MISATAAASRASAVVIGSSGTDRKCFESTQGPGPEMVQRVTVLDKSPRQFHAHDSADCVTLPSPANGGTQSGLVRPHRNVQTNRRGNTKPRSSPLAVGPDRPPRLTAPARVHWIKVAPTSFALTFREWNEPNGLIPHNAPAIDDVADTRPNPPVEELGRPPRSPWGGMYGEPRGPAADTGLTHRVHGGTRVDRATRAKRPLD